MRQETIIKTWLKFDELSKAGQDKAISDNYSWNIKHDWWEITYEDAKQVGIKIQSFDIYRGSFCRIQFEWSALQVAEEIIKQHGESCDTYKVAKQFIEDFKKLESQDQEDDGSIDELKENFKIDISTEYLHKLKQKFEYLTSDEAIKESLIANEFEFDAEKYEAK